MPGAGTGTGTEKICPVPGPAGAGEFWRSESEIGKSGGKAPQTNLNLASLGDTTAKMHQCWDSLGVGKIIGGAKITEKIARYLVLKRQKMFKDPLKPVFWMIHERYPEK